MNIICIDVETGGLDPAKNPITQVAWYSFNVDQLSEISRGSYYVKPYDGMILEEAALNYTGHTVEKLEKNGMPVEHIYKTLVSEFKKASTNKRTGKVYLMGHNVGFDQGFLEHLFKRCGDDIYKHVQDSSIDTLALSRVMWAADTTMSKFDLQSCCDKIGFGLVDAHNALNDVLANVELWKYIQTTLQNPGGETSQRKTNEKRAREHFQIV